MTDQVENVEADESDVQLRFLLVDTNSFLRIYQSSLRPILGTNVAGFCIRTLTDLVDEFRTGKRLQDVYGWANEDIEADVAAGAVLILDDATRKDVREEQQLVKKFGNILLENHCVQRSISVRSLSNNDARLIAAALVLNAVIATDEWPMTYVVQDLIDADERNVEIWNSFDLLHLLEGAGYISAEDRRETVKSWIRYQEALPRNWEAQYAVLFNEATPRLQ